MTLWVLRLSVELPAVHWHPHLLLSPDLVLCERHNFSMNSCYSMRHYDVTGYPDAYPLFNGGRAASAWELPILFPSPLKFQTLKPWIHLISNVKDNWFHNMPGPPKWTNSWFSGGPWWPLSSDSNLVGWLKPMNKKVRQCRTSTLCNSA